MIRNYEFLKEKLCFIVVDLLKRVEIFKFNIIRILYDLVNSYSDIIFYIYFAVTAMFNQSSNIFIF